MHILIIRPGAIGDSLLTFPIIQVLRTKFSDAYITLVSNAAVLPLAVKFGLVEEVSDYGHLQWSELFSTEGIHNPAMQERLQRTDLAICWLRDPGGVVERNLRLAGAKQVIVAVGRPPEGSRVHVTDYLAETVGLKGVYNLLPEPMAQVTQKRDGATFAIHPGSGKAEKCWPPSSFAALIERLWQHNYSVLLLAGPADYERINNLQSRLSSPPRPDMLHVLIDAPLKVVAEHLQQCRGYLGNDSGITHLAAMLGVPTVALFGPSDPAIWRPVGPSVEVIQAQELEQVPVNLVLEKIP